MYTSINYSAARSLVSVTKLVDWAMTRDALRPTYDAAKELERLYKTDTHVDNDALIDARWFITAYDEKDNEYNNR